MGTPRQGISACSHTDVGIEKWEAHSGFQPDRLASLEVAGWRAYVDREWLWMLWLLLSLAREQFGFSWPRAIEASYYAVRASVIWKPVRHDVRAVRRYLRKFYRLAVKHGKGFSFDPRRVAELELRYWHVSRKIALTPYTDDSPLIPVFAELNSAIFRIPVADALPSALGRARSVHTYGRITSGQSTDTERDWLLSEQYLREAYRSIVLR